MAADNQKTKTIVFLCSGNGGNIKFIHWAIENNLLPNHRIIGLLADQECGALDFGRKHHIHSEVIDFKEREQISLRDKLRLLNPDVIFTTVNKIIASAIVREFQNHLLNLHYSLLPSFGGLTGMKPIDRAFNHGCKFAGVTVHRLTAEVDMGTPVAQVAFPIDSQIKNSSEIYSAVFSVGCLLLLQSLNTNNLNTNAIQKVINLDCIFNPPLDKKLSQIAKNFPLEQLQ